MKRLLEVVCVAGIVLLGGCATKNYVAKQVDPVQQKINDVDKNQQSTQKQLEGDEPKISAADEKASSADARATDALGRADAASKKADQVRSDLQNELSDKIANIDDYKQSGEVTVLFKLNSDKLSDDAKQQLDQMTSGEMQNSKRYFIAVQGFTDKTGTAEHNLELSRRRAEAVQTYLVAQHNIPLFRIQIVGLGKDKPVNDEKTRKDRADNRRVEVTLFTIEGTQSSENRPPRDVQ